MDKNIKDVYLTLCAGRHETPVQTAIFESIDPTSDFSTMELDATFRIGALIGECERCTADACERSYGWQKSYADHPIEYVCARLVIYVTGYTPALVAAINAAHRLHILEVTLMHYDKGTGEYRPQYVDMGA